MLKRDDKLLLEDILENIACIIEFTTGKSYEEFIADKMRVLAVIRCFEVIGEASNFISHDLK